MAQTKVTELPVITLEDFTNNDRFLIVDDGKVRQLSRPVLQEWITENVKGERGEQGFAGVDGKDGRNGVDGKDGKDGLSAYQLFINSGFTGTEQQWRDSLKGERGSRGIEGTNGWSPILQVVARGNDYVLKVSDWTGGTGNKPSISGYVGINGVVDSISNAINIRGQKGDKGEQGAKGEQGDKGETGEAGGTIQSINYNPDSSIKITYSGGEVFLSNPPPKRTGWGVYEDSKYTSSNPFTVQPGSQEVLPNNKNSYTESLPTGVDTFYDNVTQKYFLEDIDGYYSVRVSCKVAPSTDASILNLSMNKGTTDVPYSEDRVLRGDNKVQDVNFSTTLYGSQSLSSNGLSIVIKSYDRAVVIYDIEVAVAKLM